MLEINYVTNNDGKVKLANMIYKDLNIKIIKEAIETLEIQNEDCVEVAKYSAKYASSVLNKAVLKNDSGLVIPALNGFPGAYAKYAEESLGAEGFIKLMEGKSRECYWVEALAYCKPGVEPVVFVSYTYGTIAESIREGRGYDYDKIFIPDGDTRTFSQMSEEEQFNCFDTNAYIKLYNYLKENH